MAQDKRQYSSLYQKVLLHQSAIDIHFPDLGRWRSIMYLCPISQEYLWAPSAKTVRAAAVQALVAWRWKVYYWNLTAYYTIIYTFLPYSWGRILLPLWVIRYVVWEIITHASVLLVDLFDSGFLKEGKKNKYTLPLPIVLKFKVFNIYLWKGNTGFKKSNMLVHV